MGGGGGNTEGGEPEFQIAPMIDVLLVLLVFFMAITTSEIAVIDKTIKLPTAPDAKKKEKGQVAHEVALNVRWDKGKAVVTYENQIEGKDITKEKIVEIIKNKFERDKLTRVVIRADQDVPAKYIQEVMSIAGTGGVEDISFAALNQ